jgi:hypothetical protein
MAKFFKHVGEHNGKKVVIVQRTIPGEDHMCSVVYSQIIPSQYHDDIMRVLESTEGQHSKEFYEILQRRIATNGSNLLQAIATEGYLKKAPTNQVIVKPNASSAIRLDELNNLLRMAGEGDHAMRKLEELDRQRGFADTRKTNVPMPTEYGTDVAAGTGALSDADLAQINIKQAADMKAQAESLLAEATRLESVALTLDPSLSKTTKGRKTSGTQSKKTTA